MSQADFNASLHPAKGKNLKLNSNLPPPAHRSRHSVSYIEILLIDNSNPGQKGALFEGDFNQGVKASENLRMGCLTILISRQDVHVWDALFLTKGL